MRLALALLFATPLVVACDTFDPAPEVAIVSAANGFWTEDDPIVLQFTEPVDPATLSVSIWPNGPEDRDIEGDFVASAEPFMKPCTVATSPCDRGITLDLDDNRTRATITVGNGFDGNKGVPFMLIVEKGLKDDAGRERKVDTTFDFQISLGCADPNPNEPLAMKLETGMMSLTFDAQSAVNIPFQVRMYVDIAVDPVRKQGQILATYAKLKEGEDFIKNYTYPDGFEMQLDEVGWAIAFNACIIDGQSNNEYFIQSDPFDVVLTFASGIEVELYGFRVSGTLVPGGDIEAGRDAGSGTVSTTGGLLTIGGRSTEVGAVNAQWEGWSFEADEIVPALPRVCEDDPCAELIAAGGDCQIPASWDTSAYCPAE